MSVLPAVVLFAEAAALGWFIIFLTTARHYEREGRSQRQMPRDASGRAFLVAVRLAFATALAGVITLSVMRVI